MNGFLVKFDNNRIRNLFFFFQLLHAIKLSNDLAWVIHVCTYQNRNELKLGNLFNMHWKCSEIFWGKYTVVYWVQFWDLFLDQLNGKILKMAYFWVSIGVENLEKMCAWKTLWLLFCSLFLPLLKMVLLFKLTLIELQDFWLHLKPPVFSFLFAKVIGFSHENCWQEKKRLSFHEKN